MAFTTSILEWFRENGRDLPWRHTDDPYAIWLSEIILQQTRIEQGLPYWQRFMGQWPTVEQLAAATEDAVLREWQGLGYYSRARNLLTAARQIVERGAFPDSLEGIKALKGVGDYTAAAVGSIAFGLPVAVVDGNVFRVLSRYFGIATPINTTEGKKEFTALAQSLLPPGEASAFNQAMMDFGAIQCTPQGPRCLLCPLQEGCMALRTGMVAQLPIKLRKLKVKERHLTYVYIRCNGQTAIRRRPAGDIWQGLYEPFAIEHLPQHTRHLAAPEGSAESSGQCPAGQAQCAGAEWPVPREGWQNARCIRQHVRHVLTHRVLYADFYLWQPDEKPPLPADYFWVDEADIDTYAVPRLVEILLEEVKKHLQR